MTGVVEKRLIAARQRRPDALAFRGRVPVGRGSDRSLIGNESDQHGLSLVALAHELPDVDLTVFAHFRGARVAEMGVVFPNHDARRLALSREKTGQMIERVRHMAVAQVPRRFTLADIDR